MEAKAFISSLVSPGDVLTHKTYGKGIVRNVDGDKISIEFSDGNIKKLSITGTARIGLIDYHNSDLPEKATYLGDLLGRERSVTEDLERAKNKLAPYLDYLED